MSDNLEHKKCPPPQFTIITMNKLKIDVGYITTEMILCIFFLKNYTISEQQGRKIKK